MRLKKNVLGGPCRKIELKPALRYAGSNKGTPAPSRTTPLLVCSSIATTPCRKVTAAYALNYLKLRFLSANMIALVGIVLYNAIKEYYDDGTRKIIYFYSYTVEDNYNAICEKWKRLSEIRYNYHDNDVNNILMKCIDNERQRYNILIEDYNCAGKREDNILTVDECRTGYSNEEDIEADEREELELEDCDALVERYEEEINCSDLYSTV
ncbi:hypothetical protein HBI21_187510 [Parastagonospora nodorum]|nr:hypothetical protein HBI21_187510 [Parastagonospora nodorum]